MEFPRHRLFSALVAVAVAAALSLVGRPNAMADDICTEAGRNGSQCPPFAVCSVVVGACESGKAPLSVCTGHCETGGLIRVVPRAGAYVGIDDEAGPLAGIELVLPQFGGAVSVRGEWWVGDGGRVGPVVSFPIGDWFKLGTSASAVRTAGQGAIGISARLEYFPWHIEKRLVPLQYISAWIEAGTSFLGGDQGRIDQVSGGLGVWL